jgi:hypothetical protein
MRNELTVESGQNSNGSWEHQLLAGLPSYQALTPGQIASHVVRDPAVGIWIGIVALILGIGTILYQQQRLDRNVRELTAALTESQADRHEIHHEIEQVKAVVQP